MGKALHRRDFIRKAGLASGAAVLSPYWLNAINRLSHSENKPHVVLCILGGGVRKSDTLGMQWGNLMPHLFVGSRPIDGRLASSMPQLPRVFERPFQEQGTLFTQLRYAKGAISHSIAHHALLTGSYSNQHYSSYEKPNKADIFDVLSQELGFAEIEDMGWMANTLGRYEAIGGRFTVNAQFQKWGTASPSNFLQETERTLDAWGLGTLKIFEDLRSIAAVSHYINAKRPKFVAFNLQGADCCHYNFTQYCANVHAVDYALARMWQGIQDTPQLAGNTVLIIVPDHGRNTRPNLLEDENDLAGYDHYDEDARESFCLIAGPTQRVPQCAIIETSVQTIDVAPTVAQILGVEAHKLAQYFEGQSLLEHVVRA